MSEDLTPASLPIEVEDIASAEKIMGLTFTDAERAQLRKTVSGRVSEYDRLRTVELANDVPMPLYFDPRLPADRGEPVEAVTRSASYEAPSSPSTRPDNLKELAFAPLTVLAELVRTRQVSSRELTDLYLRRLKQYDPVLHCVVTLTEDLAYEQASRADREIDAGHYRGPLHGVPWGVKDLFAVRGYPTTWGAEPYRDQVIDVDATIVRRLEAAGAVLVAKLTLGALAYGDLCFDVRTRNPWNVEQGSSGSSAGSASAVAAGLVGFAIGTETLGSIVAPSVRCGLTGLRPTFGRVSRYGAMTLSWSLDKVGPMARSVEDCALIFDALYGPDGQDAAVVAMPFEWRSDVVLSSLRIGYVVSAFEAGTENDRAVLETLRALGADLHPIELPDDDVDSLRVILFAEAAAAFDNLTRSNHDDLLTWQDDDAWPNSIRAARFIPAVEYIQANRARMLLMQKMATLMQTVDVFVIPPFANNVLTMMNLTGHPGVVLPSGFAEDGTPTGITFIGQLYREADVLAVAKAYQDATTFHLQHPSVQI